MARVYLSLGSNQGDREGTLREAVRLLSERGVVPRSVSSLYETAPVGYTDQPAFLNAVLEADTDLAPDELLQVTQSVENALRRVRVQRWGPRTLDVDILLYDDRVIDRPELTLPHPLMQERRFVLVPLVEVAPDLPVPGHGPVRDLLNRLDAQEQPVTCVGPFPSD